jgi:hypothetical protein
MEDTCTSVLNEIVDWVANRSEEKGLLQRIYSLPYGIGKTSLAHSICAHLCDRSGDNILKPHSGGTLYRCTPRGCVGLKESCQLSRLTGPNCFVEYPALQGYPMYASYFVYHHGRQSKSNSHATSEIKQKTTDKLIILSKDNI